MSEPRSLRDLVAQGDAERRDLEDRLGGRGLRGGRPAETSPPEDTAQPEADDGSLALQRGDGAARGGRGRAESPGEAFSRAVREAAGAARNAARRRRRIQAPAIRKQSNR